MSYPTSESDLPRMISETRKSKAKSGGTPSLSMASSARRTFDEISRSLQEFAVSDKMLRSPHLMRPYTGKWVAAYQGKVIVVSDDLVAVQSRLRVDKIPLATVAIRFIEKDGIAA
jgi:hypothetical protein